MPTRWRGSAGIWGCISYEGAGVCSLYDGRITAEKYIEVLEDYLIPSLELLVPPGDPYLFQQDNASPHTAKITQEKFVEMGIPLLEWPAKSPDLNPIEHIWAWIDRQLARKTFDTIAELKDGLHEAWMKIPAELCAKLVLSMKRRVKMCIAARGSYTKY